MPPTVLRRPYELSGTDLGAGLPGEPERTRLRFARSRASIYGGEYDIRGALMLYLEAVAPYMEGMMPWMEAE